MKKSLAIYTGLAIVISISVWFLIFISAGAEPKMETPFQTSTAQYSDLVFITINTIDKPVSIEIQGRIKSAHRLELFPEVQGIVEMSSMEFREGVSFSRGQTLISLNNSEYLMQLQANRSAYIVALSNLIPDIKLDYPSDLSLFESWYSETTPFSPIPEIPEFSRELSRYMSSRGIYDRYFSLMSAENRLHKFTIKAPFDGQLSIVRVESGQSVGPQHHLGTFIDSNNFILTASIRKYDAEKIPIGTQIDLYDQDRILSAIGTLTRKNPVINPATQMIELYFSAQGRNLREGQFLSGDITSTESQYQALIPKTALLRSGHVYTLRENKLIQVPVQLVGVEKDRVWVRGLLNDDHIVQDHQSVINGFILP